TVAAPAGFAAPGVVGSPTQASCGVSSPLATNGHPTRPTIAPAPTSSAEPSSVATTTLHARSCWLGAARTTTDTLGGGGVQLLGRTPHFPLDSPTPRPIRYAAQHRSNT